MKIREIKELVRERMTPATEHGKYFFHISPSLAVVSTCETVSLNGETMLKGETHSIDAYYAITGEVRIVGYNGWFRLEDFEALPCLAVLVECKTQIIKKISLPKKDLFRFLQEFGERFAIYCPELDRKILRPVQSYCEDTRGDFETFVYVEILPEEEGDLRTFVKYFT